MWSRQCRYRSDGCTHRSRRGAWPHGERPAFRHRQDNQTPEGTEAWHDPDQGTGSGVGKGWGMNVQGEVLELGKSYGGAAGREEEK